MKMIRGMGRDEYFSSNPDNSFLSTGLKDVIYPLGPAQHHRA